jgi:hypothetical protein
LGATLTLFLSVTAKIRFWGACSSALIGRLLWGNDPPHGGFPLTGWGVKQNSSIRQPGEGIIAGRVGVEAVFPEFVEAPAAVDAAQD